MLRLLAIALLVATDTGPPPDLIGAARVIDGNTIAIGTTELGLYGVDAPERSQSCSHEGRPWPCGYAAASALRRKLQGQTVTCEPQAKDQHHRLLAVCFVGEEDVNGWLVAEGWAVASRRYATDYVPEEDEARAAGRGLWSGEFEMPWLYRRRQHRR